MYYKNFPVSIETLEYELESRHEELVRAIVTNPKFDLDQAIQYIELYADSRRDVIENDLYPIHLAAKYGNVDALTILLQRCPSDLEKTSREKMTPLHWAVDSGIVELVKTLVEAGANIDAKASLKERSDLFPTPLVFALVKGVVEVAKVLIEAGANVFDPTIPHINITNPEMSELLNKAQIIQQIIDKISERAGLDQTDLSFVKNLPELESKLFKIKIIKKFPLPGMTSEDLTSANLDDFFSGVITSFKDQYEAHIGSRASASAGDLLVGESDKITASVLDAISRLGSGVDVIATQTSSDVESIAANASQPEVVEPETVLTPELQEQVDALVGFEESQKNDELLGSASVIEGTVE